MSSLSVNQWLHNLAHQEYGQLPQLRHTRALSDVAISILQQGHVLKDSSFLHDFSTTDQNILLFDLMYQNSQGELIGVLVADAASKHLPTIERWAALSVGKPDVPSIHGIEVYSHDGALAATWSLAQLNGMIPETFEQDVSTPTVPASLDQLAQSLAMWRLLSQDADQNAKKIEQEIAAMINKRELDKVDNMDFGIARSKINKAFDLNKVNDKVIELMKQQEFSDVDIETLYQRHPNFWNAEKFDQETLIDLIQSNLGVDVRQDERFFAAISQEKTANLNTRVDYLESMAKEMGVEIDWDELVDWDNCVVKTELVRESMTGTAKHLRSSLVSALRSKVQPLVDHAAEQYASRRQTVLAAAPKKKARKRK